MDECGKEGGVIPKTGRPFLTILSKCFAFGLRRVPRFTVIRIAKCVAIWTFPSDMVRTSVDGGGGFPRSQFLVGRL